ncbi:MAG: polysaccharide biosynthesis protein [Rhodospirillaceae bacterium]|nr:polysaccharide biosynthesis protein [Rhodospirillaceae bacterium]
MFSRGQRRLLISYSHDVLAAAVSFLASLYLRLGSEIFEWPRQVVGVGLIVFTAVAALVIWGMRLDRIVWRYVSIGDLWRIIRATFLIVVIFLAVQFIFTRLDDFPRSFLVIEIFVLTGMLAGSRFAYRLLREGRFSGALDSEGHRRVPVLLIGAGDGTDQFIREMARGRDAPYRAIAIIDDRGNRVGRNIRGINVAGTLEELPRILEHLRQHGPAPERVVITRAEIEGGKVRNVIDIAGGFGLTVSRMPPLTAFHAAEGDGRPTVRPVNVEDVLGRPQAVLDRDAMGALVQGKRTMVTGAGGTIGGELARQIAALGPAELTLVDASEFQLYTIDLEISELAPDLQRSAVLADVRDKTRVREILGRAKPDLIFHAAALKHVPLVEANATDGVLTNLIGTRNVAEAAIEFSASAMVLISTDKAVNPTNVMGATKRAAEMFCQALDIESRAKNGPQFVTVRFGNVLGSTGSVIPLFQRQLARGGPLTVTHPDMTRYFMTVREAVELVLQASALEDNELAEGGAICVLDMGQPVRILDLARQMIRLAGLSEGDDIEIEFTGLRPGEKLYEELFHEGETLLNTAVPGIHLARPRTADLALLRRALDELEAAARARQNEQTLAQLQRLVPELQHNDDVTPDADREAVKR